MTGTRFLLVDGRVRATWTVAERDGDAELAIAPLGGWTPGRDRDEVVEEGTRLLRFRTPDAATRTVAWR